MTKQQGFIIFAIALFVLYCLGVAIRVGKVPMPRYETRTLDLIGHHEGTYDVDSPAAKERLRNFARRGYLRMPANHNVNYADEPLTEEKLRAAVLDNPHAANHFTVVSGERVYELAKANYRFAVDTKAGDQVFSAGAPLNLEALKVLVRYGKIKTLRVAGNGETISIQPGTMAMIIIIFIALLCALKMVLFDPLLKIMDERDAEINEGNAHRRGNTLLAQKLDRELAETRMIMRRNQLNSISEARGAANAEAGKILRKAHEEARRKHEETLADISRARTEIMNGVAKVVPDLARQIVGKILGFSLNDGGNKISMDKATVEKT